MSNHITITDRSNNGPVNVMVNDECNHAAAEMQDVTVERFDADSHQMVPDDSEERLVCPCGAQFVNDDDGGEWLQ